MLREFSARLAFGRLAPSVGRTGRSDRVRTRLARIQAGRLDLFCRQAVRIPLGVGVLCAYIVYMLWEHNNHTQLIVWAAATWVALALRAVLSWMLRRRDLGEREVERWTRAMVAICFVNGALGGAAGWLFFEPSPLAEQAILTMLLCCWSAGAIATSGAIPAAFYAFLVPFLAPITVSWAAANMYGSQVTALLIVLFGGYLIVFVRDNARMVTRALLRRFKNTALIGVLNEKRREAEEANRSKSRFLAAASHDLRQPMNALSINSYLLRQSAPDAKTLELATELEKSVRGLDELFSGLLDISRLDAGTVVPKWRNCILRPSFDQIIRDQQPVAAAKGLRLIVDGVDVPVRTDPLLFGRVLRNLLSNAIRYTQTGSVRLHTQPMENHLCVEVIDSGIGIAKDELERVFEEFYQVGNPGRDREQGTGLGLAIVRRYADLLQCEIEVESAPGEGSTFRVLVPRSEAGQVDPELDAAPGGDVGFDLTGLAMLVIDDDIEVRTAMEKLLTDWGCVVLLGAGYDEAIDALECSGVGPDFIIADYRLRNGENGIDVVRLLKEHYGDTPALLVTGDTAPERLLEANASGFPVLYKPITPEALYRTIRQLHAARAETST